MAILYFHPPGTKPIKKETIQLIKRQRRKKYIVWTVLGLSICLNAFLIYLLS